MLSSDEKKILRIRKFEEILNSNFKIDENTLILVDIDDTVFSSPSHYGACVDFGRQMYEMVKKTGCTFQQAKILITPDWIRSQSTIKTKLVDDAIHTFFTYAREQGATIIGLTARQPAIAEVTYKQLTKHKIYFDKLENLIYSQKYSKNLHSNEVLCKEMKHLNHEIEVLFYEGILFCHDLNKKGEVFDHFYEKLLAYRKSNNLKPFERWGFIDDAEHNLVSVKSTAAKHSVDYFAYHIQSSPYLYDAKEARAQEKISKIEEEKGKESHHTRRKSIDLGQYRSLIPSYIHDGSKLERRKSMELLVTGKHR
ncbi:MAG: DUF2608 domain-containing protein [Sphingobacteriia bacterium]|nr:DUF2608 domain-containing protein [Sphingobacteriia bacterium]